MNLQTYIIASALVNILSIFIRGCPGILSFFLFKLCCLYSNPKVGRSSNIFKFGPSVLFGLQTMLLISYLLLCLYDKWYFSISITVYLSMYLLCALFTRKWFKKIPIICLGRRHCCAYGESKQSLKEILLRIDLFVPIRQELVSLQNICMRRGGEVIRYSLERKFNEIHPVSVLFTGSAFENFGLPTSSDWIKDFDTIPNGYPLLTDFDLMLCFDNVFASMGNDQNAHFQIHDSTQQGFVMLSTNNYGVNNLSKGIFENLLVSIEVNNTSKEVLSAKKVKKLIYSLIADIPLDSFQGGQEDVATGVSKINMAKLSKGGPAVQLQIGSTKLLICCFDSCRNLEHDGFLADFAFGIKAIWPSASDWKDRTGRFWPSPEEVNRIVEGGSHFVAKSQTDDNIGITWRYSFSKAEVELSKLVNPVARKCYLALKVILKDHLQLIAPWLKSYHLKTILYWTLEKTSTDVWRSDDIEACFNIILENLKTSLNSGVCQHFWISTIDLFDTKSINQGCQFRKISTLINKILANPEIYFNIFDPKIEKSLNYENQITRSYGDEELVEIGYVNYAREPTGSVNYSYESVDIGDQIELL